MLDVDALSTMIADIVSEEVGKAVTPLNAKIAELEARPVGTQMDDVQGVVEIMISDAFVKRSANAGTGKDGRDGKDGQDGKDGRGIKDLLVDREGHLIATMDDGTTKDLGHIIGKDGKDGQDGAPGFGLDDFDIEPASDGRTFTLKFTRGEVCHSYDLTFPVNIDAGVWKEAEGYVPGDGVTWGGQYYYCQQETKGEKPDQSKDGKPWRLAIRKGRDGKDAKNG